MHRYSFPGRQQGEARAVIEYYEDQVPPFVEAELKRLYGNVFSSLQHLRQTGMHEKLTTYVVRNPDACSTVLLLRQKNHRVQVMNEGMKINEGMVIQFADAIFSRCRSVHSITFNAVESSIRRLPFPSHRFNFLEDIVLAMPATIDAYYAQLGKSTQRYISRYLHKVSRDFPSVHFEVHAGQDIQEEHIHAIIAMNKSRMAGKHKRVNSSQERIAQIIMQSRYSGFVGLIRIDGVICAGTINFCEGDNFFLNSVAHDSRFSDYRLGTLCCYLSICECIRQGGKEFHFLWGEYDYKYHLKGVKRELDHLVVYRSRGHMLLDMATVLRNGKRDYTRRCKRWLHEKEKQEGIVPKILGQARHLAGAMR